MQHKTITAGLEIHIIKASISVSPDKGFQLNGVTMKLKGGCVHSENLLVLLCSYVSLQIQKLKQ